MLVVDLNWLATTEEELVERVGSYRVVVEEPLACCIETGEMPEEGGGETTSRANVQAAKERERERENFAVGLGVKVL